MNITHKTYKELEDHLFSASSDGGDPFILLGITLKRLGVTVDNKELPALGFTYNYVVDDVRNGVRINT